MFIIQAYRMVVAALMIFFLSAQNDSIAFFVDNRLSLNLWILTGCQRCAEELVKGTGWNGSGRDLGHCFLTCTWALAQFHSFTNWSEGRWSETERQLSYLCTQQLLEWVSSSWSVVLHALMETQISISMSTALSISFKSVRLSSTQSMPTSSTW